MPALLQERWRSVEAASRQSSRACHPSHASPQSEVGGPIYETCLHACIAMHGSTLERYRAHVLECVAPRPAQSWTLCHLASCHRVLAVHEAITTDYQRLCNLHGTTTVATDAGVLSSLPAEALCIDLAAKLASTPAAAPSDPAAAAQQPAASAASNVQDCTWTFLINGALAAALDAAAAPPDAHHRVYAMAAVAAALEKVEELLKVGGVLAAALPAVFSHQALGKGCTWRNRDPETMQLCSGKSGRCGQPGFALGAGDATGGACASDVETRRRCSRSR